MPWPRSLNHIKVPKNGNSRLGERDKRLYLSRTLATQWRHCCESVKARVCCYRHLSLSAPVDVDSKAYTFFSKQVCSGPVVRLASVVDESVAFFNWTAGCDVSSGCALLLLTKSVQIVISLPRYLQVPGANHKTVTAFVFV